MFHVDLSGLVEFVQGFLIFFLMHEDKSDVADWICFVLSLIAIFLAELSVDVLNCFFEDSLWYYVISLTQVNFAYLVEDIANEHSVIGMDLRKD